MQIKYGLNKPKTKSQSPKTKYKMIYQTQKFIFCFLLCFFCLQGVVLATSLTAYRQKIQEINESVALLSFPDEDLSESEQIAEQREILQRIRAKLPQTEKVELTGTTFEVNHGLFLEKFKEFDNEPYNSLQRISIINELSERLSALESKLTELENQALSNQTKDQEKQKLDEILKRPEFQKPEEKEETWLQRKWREFWEWLWKVTPKPERQIQESQGSPMLSTTLLLVILVVALALISFLIYRFAPFIAQRFRERERKEKNSRVILGETLSVDDTSHNIFAEAENLAQEGNLRGAIRKGYIALLCELSDRKIIRLAQHKTNRDYLRDVRKQAELHQKMNMLTSNFERNWYGLKQTKEDDWEEFKQNYHQTIGEKS